LDPNQLYLLRHAKAVADDEDRTRPLAPRGEAQARWLGEAMSDRHLHVDRVLHSPKLRARRTAELFSGRALPGVPVGPVDWLYPEDDVDPWVSRLRHEPEVLLLVGHNTFMERLAEALTGREVRFKTCTLAAFRRSGNAWELAWTETPLREIGQGPVVAVPPQEPA